MTATHSRALDRGYVADFRSRYGDWAVVTGASDGIGKAAAQGLAARGLNLVLVARRKEVLDSLAESLSIAHSIQCKVMALDLTDIAAVSQLTRETESLDVGLLIAAAGFGTSGAFIESALSDELDMLAVNARATTALTHHFAGRFAKQRRGGIILMSSIVAFQGVPRAAHYAATKAYVQTLAEGLRFELAPFGVTVVASAPGPVSSGFAARANMQLGAALTPSTVAEGSLKALDRGGTVRPGWLSKLLGWSLATVPRFVRTLIMSGIMHGMTRHHAPPEAQAGQLRP